MGYVVCTDVEVSFWRQYTNYHTCDTSDDGGVGRIALVGGWNGRRTMAPIWLATKGESDAPMNVLAPRIALEFREKVRATTKSHKRKVSFCLSWRGGRKTLAWAIEGGE